MAKAERLMGGMRGVLLRDWDPLGVANDPKCSGEYDRYARTVCRYLEEGADEHKLSAYLSQVQAVGMGLLRVVEPRDTRIARRLLALSR